MANSKGPNVARIQTERFPSESITGFEHDQPDMRRTSAKILAGVPCTQITPVREIPTLRTCCVMHYFDRLCAGPCVR